MSGTETTFLIDEIPVPFKPGQTIGQNVSRPPFPDFDSERRGRRASWRVWRENLSGSTSRRLLAREVVRCVDRLGPAMPADNANGARLRALYPLRCTPSTIWAETRPGSANT